MKAILYLAPIMLLAGCASPSRNIAALVKELARDEATAYVRVVTSFGVFEMVRTNPKTNTLPHVVTRDGNITVGVQQK